MVLHGPHARHLQVLPGRAGLAIPQIVRDIDEHLGAVGGELAHLAGKDRFITDEDARAGAVQVKDLALSAAGKVTHFAGKLGGKKQQILQGYVFAERNKVDFVITAGNVAARVHQQRGVQRMFPSPGIFRLARAADHQIGVGVLGQRGEPLLEPGIGNEEGRGRLRPDDQPGIAVRGPGSGLYA